MLHDPSHYEPPPIAEEIRLSKRDVDVLRRLAGELAAIAALPVHREKARLWQKLNDLESERPMVWINEVPWHEMDVNGELALVTEHPWARDQERELRRTLYQWRHIPGDMVVSPYTSRLPGDQFDAARVRTQNMWGCSNAQIFSEVSPQMHWEFALKHDLRWLSRWGLTYYGCCEPLDRKIDILRQIPNLRKISVSPWCDTAGVVAKIGRDYVISRKPSPAILAEDRWRPERARQDLREFLDAAGYPLAGHCHVELIMKDISTVRCQPQRLWEWARMAAEVVE